MSEVYNYESAGVNIDAGNKLVDMLKKLVPLTHREGVLGNIGGFGGCFELPLERYKRPILVSSTDGVGTKLRLAIMMQQHQSIGIDLVAMCVNDLVVMGAEPLFFLDYFATGKLNVDTAESIIGGIVEGCKMANVALIGGETAEMPGMYAKNDYDLAGFTVGIVEKDRVIDGRHIQPGDTLIALAASGPHSNGYSLIRHILENKKIPLDRPFEYTTIGDTLLEPTRIYVKSILALAQSGILKGAAHITGGGFIDNIPRILTTQCAALIDTQSWSLPPIFSFLQSQGNLSCHEMRRTFNCGVGMVIAVAKADVTAALALLEEHGEKAWVIGEVVPRKDEDVGVIFSDGA